MNNAGDAAEQVVRLSLEGTEVALKLTGSAAKNVAAAIYAVLKNRDKNKIKGRQRLTAMLKSGKELKVFTISETHLKQFATEAKRYGVVYCALRGKEPAADGMVDVMVRAEDASKINRIVERFRLATVDTASIRSEIERSREERITGPDAPEQDRPPRSAEEQLLDEMMASPTRKEAAAPKNPTAARTSPSPPSEPTSKPPGRAAEGTAIHGDDRPSVRKELRDIQQRRKGEATSERRDRGKTPRHTQYRPKKER